MIEKSKTPHPAHGEPPRRQTSAPSRRDFIKGAGLAAGAIGLAGCAPLPRSNRIVNGRLKQSIAGWCFMNRGPKWSVEQLASKAAKLGCSALELVGEETWPVLRRHGLICAATRSHTFVRGMNNPLHWDECLAKLRPAIEATAAANFPNVMTFTGFADTSSEPRGSLVGPEEGIENCVRGYKKIIGLAERKGVSLILEQLNSRDPQPMKGHPGYQGDHMDECMEIIQRVGSPNLKLLFDVYHVQVMDGDLIRRIHQAREVIGHVQVAGCPGRGGLGSDQEINYAAVMKAFVEIGFEGYIGHEWIPTGDADQQLAQAVSICDV